MEYETGYYTLLVPFSETPTMWHPTDRTGPFSVLNRGAFATYAALEVWAASRLNGQPYSSLFVSGHAFDASLDECKHTIGMCENCADYTCER